MSIATDELPRILCDHSTDAVAILDATVAGFPLLAGNRAFRDLLADPRRPLVGEPWAAVVPHADEQGILDIFARVAASGEPFRARDFPGRLDGGAGGAGCDDGAHLWDWRCLPVGGFGEVEQLVIILADATARRAEREREALFALVAHEVKSPLTAIKGFAQLARRAVGETAGEGGARVARHLGRIEEQVARLDRLVDELAEARRLRQGTHPSAPAGEDASPAEPGRVGD